MSRFPAEWLEKLYSFAYFGALGAFAATVGLLVQVARKTEAPLTGTMLIGSAMAGFYLGMVFGILTPETWDERDALVLLIGASGMKGVEVVSSLARDLISQVIKSRAPPK